MFRRRRKTDPAKVAALEEAVGLALVENEGPLRRLHDLHKMDLLTTDEVIEIHNPILSAISSDNNDNRRFRVIRHPFAIGGTPRQFTKKGLPS